MKINDITIKVNHFGPLEKVSFKLAPMMIFTGMSSLGKSYANYLVYYFMSAVCNGKLLDFVKQYDENSDEPKQLVFDIDIFFKELSELAEKYMRRFLGDDELNCDVEFKSSKRKRTFSFELRKVKTEISETGDNQDDSLLHTPQVYEFSSSGEASQIGPINFVRYHAVRILQEFILGEFITRAVILPPGRGAFAGENFSMKSEVASSMNMYNLFFRDYDFGINTRIHLGEDNEHHLSDRLLKLTSGGELLSVEGKQYLQLDKGNRISLSAGASSVKDLSPWLFYLKHYWVFPFSFCMEEPEAHQHPSVTVQIADVMAIAMHQSRASVFHLTTHSDYLIQRLNQLVKLGSIRRKDKALFLSICEERGLDVLSYLDAKDIQAYYFRKGEKGKTVVDNLEVTDDGIPMNSFFDVVRDLENREEYINEAIYRLEKE